MSHLEHYVNNIRTLTQQGNFGALCEFVTRSFDQLTKNVGQLDNVLGTLDIKEHTLGVLGLLWAKYSTPITDFETLFAQTQEFILTCSPEQLIYALDNFAEICHKFTHNLIQRKQAIRGIQLMSTAVRKTQMSPSHLTPIHADLCQLCLVSKCLKPALPFLDTDIAELSTREGAPAYDVKYLLLYYYYGGMIYTALKNTQRALLFFEIAVTTPSMAVSHIMLEAYKKYMLISLLVHGKVVLLPRYTSHVVTKYLKPLCQPYQEIVNAYNSNKPSEVRTVMMKHMQVFEREANLGLVKQCSTSLHKRNIQRLTKTFVTLSLSDMANRVQLSGPEEAERYILKMIADGEIHAVINQKDGMVQFLDNPEKYNNISMLFKIDTDMKECMENERRLFEMDRSISMTQQYIQKAEPIETRLTDKSLMDERSTKIQELDL